MRADASLVGSYFHACERRRGRMAVKPEEAKAALVEKAVAHVHERLPAPQAGDVERFVRSYYTDAARGPRRARSLRGGARALAPPPATAPGRAEAPRLDPTLGKHGWQSPSDARRRLRDARGGVDAHTRRAPRRSGEPSIGPGPCSHPGNLTGRTSTSRSPHRRRAALPAADTPVAAQDQKLPTGPGELFLANHPIAPAAASARRNRSDGRRPP
jgi:hypothetical protein